MVLKLPFSWRRRGSRKDQLPLEEAPPPNWRCFSYEEILRATDGFHQDNLVGRGGYAEVYRGVLQDGVAVAVKRLMEEEGRNREEEFLRELGTVSHVDHRNVCALLGCCVDCGLYLIFQFSDHGSVASHLHDERVAPLAWEVRYRIAVGTARGLEYLHRGCKRRIIHRDIKASNILLSKDLEPQISDFGLAKWLPKDWTHRAVAPIEGTFGYLAPEYFRHGIVDEKTDVFAFGVFLLEIISGKKPADGSRQNLLSCAKPFLNQGSIGRLVDPRLGVDFDLPQLNRLAYVASGIQAMPRFRPSMDQVLDIIVGVDQGKSVPDHWKMMCEEDEEVQFWGFGDLEEEEEEEDNGDNNDSNDLDSSTSSVSSTSSL